MGGNFNPRFETTDQNQFMHLLVLSRSLPVAPNIGNQKATYPIDKAKKTDQTLLVAPTYWCGRVTNPCRI